MTYVLYLAATIGPVPAGLTTLATNMIILVGLIALGLLLGGAAAIITKRRGK